MYFKDLRGLDLKAKVLFRFYIIFLILFFSSVLYFCFIFILNEQLNQSSEQLQVTGYLNILSFETHLFLNMSKILCSGKHICIYVLFTTDIITEDPEIFLEKMTDMKYLIHGKSLQCKIVNF